MQNKVLVDVNHSVSIEMCTSLQRYRALSPFHLSKKMSSFQNFLHDSACDIPPNSTEDDEYLVLPAPNLPDIDGTQIIDKEDEEIMAATVALENLDTQCKKNQMLVTENEESKMQFHVNHDQGNHKYITMEQENELSNSFSVEKSNVDSDDCECICIKCNQWFKSVNALEEHDHKAHTGVQLLKCKYCNEIFTELNMLKTHETVHIARTVSKSDNLNYDKNSAANLTESNEMAAVDKQTSAIISSACIDNVVPGLADNGVNSSSEMRSIAAKSCHSDGVAVSEADYDVELQTLSNPSPSNHIDSNVHTINHSISDQVKKMLFSCHICQKSFSRKTNLQVHLHSHSEDKDKPFGCHVCNKGFSLKINLESHLRVHSGERPYQCEICKKAFTVKSNLRNHLRTHTKEKPFKCDLCNKGFAQKCHLQTHYRSHSGEKPFVCNICGKAFSIQSNLQGHLRMHNNDRPFKCTLCPKAFTMKSNLQSHLRMHSGEKPFPCNLCEKAFAQKSNLIIHMRSHTGERPFTCAICNKSFSMKSTMTQHVKNVHGPRKLSKMKEPDPEFYCSVCHLIFEDKDNLKKHELEHLKSIMSDLKRP